MSTEKDLIRYNIDGGTGHNSGLTYREKSEFGEWVEYEKVKPLLEAAQYALASLPNYGVDSIREILTNAIKTATEDE